VGHGATGRRGGHGTVGETVCEAGEQISTVTGTKPGERVNPEGPEEVVLDKSLPQQRSAGGVGGLEGAQLLLGTGAWAAMLGGGRRRSKRRYTCTGDGFGASGEKFDTAAGGNDRSAPRRHGSEPVIQRNLSRFNIAVAVLAAPANHRAKLQLLYPLC